MQPSDVTGGQNLPDRWEDYNGEVIGRDDVDKVFEAVVFLTSEENQQAHPKESHRLAAQLTKTRVYDYKENQQFQAAMKSLKTAFPHLFPEAQTTSALSRARIMQTEDEIPSMLNDDIRTMVLMKFTIAELRELIAKKQEMRNENGDVILSQRDVQKIAPRAIQQKLNEGAESFQKNGSLADAGATSLPEAVELVLRARPVDDKALDLFLHDDPDVRHRKGKIKWGLIQVGKAENQVPISRKAHEEAKERLDALKKETPGLTDKDKVSANWKEIGRLEKEIPRLEAKVKADEKALKDARTELENALSYPFAFDRMRHLVGGREAFENLPVLDLATCKEKGYTDYIDFVRPGDMKSPIMRGIDQHNRRFISIKHRTHGQEAVFTIFERYGDSEWRTGGLTPNDLVGIVYRDDKFGVGINNDSSPGRRADEVLREVIDKARKTM